MCCFQSNMLINASLKIFTLKVLPGPWLTAPHPVVCFNQQQQAQNMSPYFFCKVL